MVPHCNAIAHERMGSASRGAAIVLAMVIPCHVWRPGGSGPVQARALSPYFWCTIFHLFRSPSLSNGNDACQLETTRLPLQCSLASFKLLSNTKSHASPLIAGLTQASTHIHTNHDPADENRPFTDYIVLFVACRYRNRLKLGRR
jgi:hypothetical protein